jgi:hypothetical protein
MKILLKSIIYYIYGINIGVLTTLALINIKNLVPNFIIHYLKDDNHNHDWIVVAIAITATATVLLHNYGDKRALAEHSKQYKRMKLIFESAKESLGGFLLHGELAEARDLTLELGKEGLAEHGAWVMLHRERPIELPKFEI